MSSSKDSARSLGAVALGATALVGISSCGQQVFAQLPVSSTPSHATMQAVNSAERSTGKVPATSSGATSTGAVLGLSLAGASVLAAKSIDSRSRNRRSKASSTSVHAFENELGVQAPVGFFDPAGMTKDGDVEAFKRRRATELKHGRVAMLACMGYITPEFFKFPGVCATNLSFKEIPNGLAAISKVPGAGWTQIFCFIGLIEKGYLVHDPSRAPGDFENAGALGVPKPNCGMVDGDKRTRKLNAELANGRLAMMAIMGMMYQDGLTGSAWGDWSLYTDSPLRAFENELGVQAPTGFWDPLGYTKDGDVELFRRRREVELKHGRVSMFATLGYIVPEYFRWPGDLSPSEGLKFKDVPNGLAAFSKVPALGWAQIFIFIGLVDYGLYRPDPSRAPGDYENAGILGVPNASGPMSDSEARKRKLNSELANGRLAMVAIMGMMFQNGFLGTTGPQMWGF